MKEKLDESFFTLIRGIVESDEYRSMQGYKHHLGSSTYEHSVKVAYLCYRHYQKHPKKVPLSELIRSALLHDYFLYDRHDRSRPDKVCGLVHGFVHPKRALENALRSYPDLKEAERDAIARHMFPLTPIPPKTRCGWLVCFYDKVAAIGDYCSAKERRRVREFCRAIRKASMQPKQVQA